LAELIALAQDDVAQRSQVIDLLTVLHDRRFDTGAHKRSQIVARIDRALDLIFRSVTPIDQQKVASADRLIVGTHVPSPPAPLPVRAESPSYSSTAQASSLKARVRRRA
jgi:hypothetical protein